MHKKLSRYAAVWPFITLTTCWHSGTCLYGILLAPVLSSAVHSTCCHDMIAAASRRGGRLASHLTGRAGKARETSKDERGENSSRSHDESKPIK